MNFLKKQITLFLCLGALTVSLNGMQDQQKQGKSKKHKHEDGEVGELGTKFKRFKSMDSNSSSSSSSSSSDRQALIPSTNCLFTNDGYADIFIAHILPFLIDVFDLQNQRDLRCICKNMQRSIPKDLVYKLIKAGLLNGKLDPNKLIIEYDEGRSEPLAQGGVRVFMTQKTRTYPLDQAVMAPGDNKALVHFLIQHNARVEKIDHLREFKKWELIDLAREAKNMQICALLEIYLTDN